MPLCYTTYTADSPRNDLTTATDSISVFPHQSTKRTHYTKSQRKTMLNPQGRQLQK